ncbi:MAG: cache domain-containing protein [Cyclobacteriaceae bacterium]
MKLRPAVSRRTYIISATMFLLTALFGYYFLAFLPKKESKLIAQRVRALDRVGENFQEKYGVYRKNIDQQINAEKVAATNTLQNQKKTLVEQRRSLQQNRNSSDLEQNNRLSTINRSIDSLDRELASLKDVLNQNIQMSKEKSQQKGMIQFGNYLSTPFNTFFSPLKILDSFDGYIVYQDSTLIYQDLPGEILRVPAKLYTELNKGSDQEGRYARHNLESRTPERYETPRVYEAGTKVQLASIDYRLFCTDFITTGGSDNSRWTIYGLVTKDHFDSEKKRIAFFNLVYLSLGLLLLLFSMPLMKLFFMSAIERLHRQDALLTPPTFIVCSAIITLLFLVTAKYYLSDIPKLDRRLSNLAQTIQQDFEKELGSIYQLTQQLPTLSIPDSSKTVSISEALKKDGTNLPDFKPYPFLRSIYWLNSEGKQKFEYSMLDTSSYAYHKDSLFDFSSRDYYKVIQNGQGFPLVSQDTLSYLQSIVSWTTGEPVSVFSLPLKDDTTILAQGNQASSVLAISTVLHSVTDPVLPPGYSFSIINKDGLVLYHTDRQKNLQENLLQEVDYTPNLMSALASRSSITTDVTYYNRSFRAHLMPLPNVPWYIVTTYDKEYLESPYQYILTFCTLGIILVSAVSALQFLIITLLYHRTSKLKRMSMSFKWLWPYRQQATTEQDESKLKATRATRYMLVVALNLIYGVLLLVYNQISSVYLPQTIASFLIAIVLSYATTFALLKEVKDRRYYLVLGISVLLSLLILFASLRLTVSAPVDASYLLLRISLLALSLVYVTIVAFRRTTVESKASFRKWDTALTSILIFGILLSAVILLNNSDSVEQNDQIIQQTYLWASLYLLALITNIVGNNIHLLVAASSKSKKATSVWVSGPKFSSLKKLIAPLAHSQLLVRHGYCLMIFSYLVLSSFLFIWFLFSKTYDYEKRIWTKFSLYQISQELEKRDERLRQIYRVNDPAFSPVNEEYRRYQQAKPYALYYRTLNFEDTLAQVGKTFGGTAFDTLVRDLRPVVTDLSAVTNGFVLHSGEGWHTTQSDTSLHLAFSTNPYFADQADTNGQLILRTKPPTFLSASFGNPSVRHVSLLLGFLLILFITYWLLKFTLFRLFGVEVFRFQKVIQIDDALMEFERKNPEQRNNNKSPHKFIVSMPFAGAEDLYGSERNNLIRIDFSRVLEDSAFPSVKDKVLELEEQNVVLEHFSYGIDDQTTNQRRLVLLENLLANANRVTIISKLTPMQITAKYEEIIENAQTSSDVEELETRVSRWKDILSSFVKLYYSKMVCERDRKRLSPDSTVKKLIFHEMGVNQAYFQRMNGTMVEKWGKQAKDIKLTSALEAVADQTDEDIKEEVLLKIQSMAQPFYFSLWNTCSKEEKYILYDLADDGFVNTKNKPVIMALMEKGLIFYDESFHIMNESFRNFILANIKPAEALKMEREARNNGRWSVYSTVILLLVVSLIFFVLFAHESIVNQFVALLAGITAAVPYLLRLVGLVGLSTGSRSSSD